MSDRSVKPERSGWRDLGLSARHRLWGFNCPAVDVDLFLEYDSRRAMGLVEYKQENAPPCHPLDDANVMALKDLANRAGIPLLGVRYAADFSWFKPKPLNKLAWAHAFTRATLTEREYVQLMYRIRGRTVPPDLFDKLGPRNG